MRPGFATLFASIVAVALPLPVVGAPSAARRAYEGPTSVAAPLQPRASAGPRAAAPRPSTESSLPVSRARPAIEPRTTVRVRPALDITITLGTAAPSIALGLFVEPALPSRVPRPGDDSGVTKIDRIALGRYERAPAIASDVLLAASVAAPFIYHAIEAGVRRRGWSTVRGRGFFVRYGTDVLLLAEALAVNALLTEVLKAAIRRPRPYAYLDPADVDPSVREDLVQDQSSNNADWSFPSGHTSTAFAATTAGATLLTLELLGRSRWAIAVAWVGGISIASTTAVLRVAAGRHFTSDVLTSALIGTAIGAAVPLAHWRPVPAGDYARARRRDSPRLRSWALLPVNGRGYTGASLVVHL
jgi:membrane-associated phospholipid phosphatase